MLCRLRNAEITGPASAAWLMMRIHFSGKIGTNFKSTSSQLSLKQMLMHTGEHIINDFDDKKWTNQVKLSVVQEF